MPHGDELTLLKKQIEARDARVKELQAALQKLPAIIEDVECLKYVGIDGSTAMLIVSHLRRLVADVLADKPANAGEG